MMRPTLSDLLREVRVAGYDESFVARVVKNLGGGRPPFVFSTSLISVLVSATESAVATSPPLNPGIDSATILVLAFFTVTAIGTSGTQLQGRVRQGSGVAGSIMNPSYQMTVAAGEAASMFLPALDTPGIVAGQQYTVTGQVVNAVANSTMGTALILAIALG